VSLRAKIVTYLIGVHVAFAIAIVWAAGGAPVWLLVAEATALVSLLLGLTLASRLLRALELGDEATRLIREADFTTRLLPVGDRRINGLIDVYNRMVDTLRGERARIQEQQHFLEQIVGASPSGMVVLDFDTRISDINPAGLALLGISRDAALGSRLDSLVSPLAAHLASLEVGAMDVCSLSGARRVRCHRGSFIDRGFPRDFFVIEELTEEARRIERAAYEKVIRVMSHEVSNTVAASNSLLESSLTYAAQLPAASGADLQHALRIAMDRSFQLNQFLRRFADVFRLPAPHRERTNVRVLLRQLVTLMQARSPETKVSCDWEDDAAPVWIELDRAQFEQACVNVIKNGVEAAGPGGWVAVAIVTSGTAATITIDDSGPGPGPEAEAHLFTPFFSTKPQGQGIGLTLVREILSGHGFGYAMERLPGGPTRFTIRLDAPPRPLP
jgi:two-component system nitrogen regulation sensor histidine kinase NtrY